VKGVELSLYAYKILCDNFIPKKHFSLIEEIKNIASFLITDFTLILHWIPSHIENTFGNCRADTLAKLGQAKSSPLDNKNEISFVRKQILSHSALLIAKIDDLLTRHPHAIPTGGPSDLSDDFSSTDAIRIEKFNP